MGELDGVRELSLRERQQTRLKQEQERQRVLGAEVRRQFGNAGDTLKYGGLAGLLGEGLSEFDRKLGPLRRGIDSGIDSVGRTLGNFFVGEGYPTSADALAMKRPEMLDPANQMSAVGEALSGEIKRSGISAGVQAGGGGGGFPSAAGSYNLGKAPVHKDITAPSIPAPDFSTAMNQLGETPIRDDKLTRDDKLLSILGGAAAGAGAAGQGDGGSIGPVASVLAGAAAGVSNAQNELREIEDRRQTRFTERLDTYNQQKSAIQQAEAGAKNDNERQKAVLDYNALEANRANELRIAEMTAPMISTDSNFITTTVVTDPDTHEMKAIVRDPMAEYRQTLEYMRVMSNSNNGAAVKDVFDHASEEWIASSDLAPGVAAVKKLTTQLFFGGGLSALPPEERKRLDDIIYETSGHADDGVVSIINKAHQNGVPNKTAAANIIRAMEPYVAEYMQRTYGQEATPEASANAPMPYGVTPYKQYGQ